MVSSVPRPRSHRAACGGLDHHRAESVARATHSPRPRSGRWLRGRRRRRRGGLWRGDRFDVEGMLLPEAEGDWSAASVAVASEKVASSCACAVAAAATGAPAATATTYETTNEPPVHVTVTADSSEMTAPSFSRMTSSTAALNAASHVSTSPAIVNEPTTIRGVARSGGGVDGGGGGAGGPRAPPAGAAAAVAPRERPRGLPLRPATADCPPRRCRRRRLRARPVGGGGARRRWLGGARVLAVAVAVVCVAMPEVSATVTAPLCSSANFAMGTDFWRLFVGPELLRPQSGDGRRVVGLLRRRRARARGVPMLLGTSGGGRMEGEGGGDANDGM